MGLSVASKAGSTLSTGSSEGNMESLVDYHKVKFEFPMGHFECDASSKPPYLSYEFEGGGKQKE